MGLEFALENLGCEALAYSFASELLIPLIENEISQREYIYAPKINDFSNSLKEILAEIS